MHHVYVGRPYSLTKGAFPITAFGHRSTKVTSAYWNITDSKHYFEEEAVRLKSSGISARRAA